MVKYHLHRQCAQKVSIFHLDICWHPKMHIPVKFLDAVSHAANLLLIYHCPTGYIVADTHNAALVQLLQLLVGNIVWDNGNAVGLVLPQLLDGIQHTSVVKAIRRWIDGHAAGQSQLPLEHSIYIYSSRWLIPHIIWLVGKAYWVKDMMGTVTGICRHCYLWHIAALTIWYLQAVGHNISCLGSLGIATEATWNIWHCCHSGSYSCQFQKSSS